MNEKLKRGTEVAKKALVIRLSIQSMDQAIVNSARRAIESAKPEAMLMAHLKVEAWKQIREEKEKEAKALEAEAFLILQDVLAEEGLTLEDVGLGGVTEEFSQDWEKLLNKQ